MRAQGKSPALSIYSITLKSSETLKCSEDFNSRYSTTLVAFEPCFLIKIPFSGLATFTPCKL